MTNYLDNDGLNVPPGQEDPAEDKPKIDSGIMPKNWMKKWEDEAARKHKERTEWHEADREYQNLIDKKYGIKPKAKNL